MNIDIHSYIGETLVSKGGGSIITSKKAKGKKRAGTKPEPIIEQLIKIPKSLKDKVKEITLNMADLMKVIAKKCFHEQTKTKQNVSILKHFQTETLENNY